MPSTKKKTVAKATQPIAPVAPAPATNGAVVTTPSAAPNLPVLYPEVKVVEYSTASKMGPLTIAMIEKTLGWETEEQFKTRKVKEVPGTKPEAWSFTIPDVGDVYHCTNVKREKVRCNNNAGNRSFDESWCEKLVYTILHGRWAGPFTIPGETVNGETVRISRYGRVLSGQHQLTAAKLADEWLQQARAEGADDRYPIWKGHEHVFLETLVVTGLSEDPRVLMTVDYVKPRSAADVFYTSKVFQESTPIERKELCKMLATAVSTLWERTDTQGYQTHPELVGFLERHMRLLDCVMSIFIANSAKAERKISKLRLNPGTSAALMYLMAASGTKPEDADDYRNMKPAPSEKGINFDYWEKAEDFWTMLTDGRDFSPVREAFALVAKSAPDHPTNPGLGGRANELTALLAKAWQRWKDHPDSGGPAFDRDDLAKDGQLSLSYINADDKGRKLPDGRIKLLDVADFEGIDCAEVAKDDDDYTPTQEEIAEATERARERRGQK